MTYIQEIVKLPLFKTIFIILFIVFSIFPPILFFYSLEPQLFEKLDFFKVLILTAGFGLSFMSLNTFYVLSSVVLINLDEDEIPKRIQSLSLALIYSIASYLGLYILMICPDAFLFKITTLKQAILMLLTFSFLIAALFIILVLGIDSRKKRQRK